MMQCILYYTVVVEVVVVVVVVVVVAGSEIALSWSPMRLEIQTWRPEFHSWSPASDL